ncbi:phospholipase D family protein, partial [Bosea sp. (in: a-proteobacteria)]|uniref:phospholipase D family protein n=1 Tax=Bosea sp. (in: a-proteobacteria) TaxID=1871050 RepID=UPI002FC6BC99
MHIFEIILIGVALLALASLAAIYSYGRFGRRARGVPTLALPVSDEETALDRAVVPLLREHPELSGLLLLADNLQAFAVRAFAARNAGRSLDLQYYYWLDDLTGGLLAREVIAAADRGVRVRLLIDDINTRGDDSGYLGLDRHANIEVRLFNPSRNRSSSLRRGIELVLRAFRATRRMHNKAWIADGRIAIIGGRNIGDAYFDASRTSNFHDMDVLLVGDAVPQAERIFDDFWNSPAVIPLSALSRSKLRRKLASQARRPLRRLVNAAPFLSNLSEQKEAHVLPEGGRSLLWTAEVEVVSDPPAKAWDPQGTGWLAERLLTMLSAARSELNIISPYFIPGPKGAPAFAAMAQRGIKVSVLTNSLAATDVVAVHGAYANYRKTLLKSGVILYELRPEIVREGPSLFGSRGASLHTKAFTVDGKAGFVGSFNFDPRSASLNTEMGVIFSDERLVDQMRAVFLQQTAPECSFQVTLEGGRLAWSDASAGGPRKLRSEPGASLGRRLAARVIGLLPIES